MIQFPNITCQAIAFDLDGTLVDTTSLHVAATRAAAQQVFAIDPPDALVVQSLGHPLPESMAIISAGRGEVVALMRAYLEYYAQHEAEGAQCFPPTTRLLAALRTRGIRLALLSNKLRAWGIAEIEHLGLSDAFEIAVFAEDMPAPKPSGLALRPILQHMGVVARDCLVIGDSVGDIACAKDAGARSGAALWGAADAASLRASQPDFLFPTMDAILEMLAPQ